MSLSLFARSVLVCGCLAVAAPAVVFGQTNNYLTNGIEYAIVGSLQGDQSHPSLGIKTTGGDIVLEDNLTDGDGLGVRGRRAAAGQQPFWVLFLFSRQRNRRGRSGTPAGCFAEQQRCGVRVARGATQLPAHLRPLPLGERNLGDPDRKSTR